MESDDMDLSTSGEEDDDDDDPELEKLLSSLTGMEKCLLPIRSEPGKAVITQEKKQVSKTPISNENSNSQDRAETPPRLPINSNRREEIKFREVNGRNNSVISISPTNSDDSNHSNASTLSRDGTPERRPSHCPKDCDNNQEQPPKQVTIAQLLDKDSESDVIIDHIDRYRKNLDTDSSNNNDVDYIGTKSNEVSLTAKSVNDSTFPNTSTPRTELNDSIVLDDFDTSPAHNTQPEIVPPAVISTETQPKQIDQNSPASDDSDSDCLIVEHIAASDHRQNGLIDLTKPTSDDETALPLQERTEESLLKEISKIRKALTKTKHTKKKHHRKSKKKHKSTKKKKRSKSRSRNKSPSLDRVSDSEDERTIVMSESGQLCVNISNDRSKTDSENSDDSAKTSKSTNTGSPVNRRNKKLPPKDSNCEKNLASTIKKSTPAIEKSTPVVEKPTTTVEKPTATVEKSTPAVEKPTATVEKSTPAVENPTATVEKSTPVVEKPTAAIEKSIPAVEKPTATVEKSTTVIENPTAVIEKSTAAVEKSSSTVENAASSKENEAESNILPENVDPSNEPDAEASPPLWNSDAENAEENFVENPTPSEVIETNPLRKKLAYCANDNTVRKPYMKIACESGKELKSKFRRKAKKLNWNNQQNKKKTFPFNNTNKFNRRRSDSEDSDSGAKRPRQSLFFRRSVPPRQRTPPNQDASSHPSRFLLQNWNLRRSVPPGQSTPPHRSVTPHPSTPFHQNVHSRRSVPPNDRFDKFLSNSDSDNDKINTVGMKPPNYGIAETYYRGRSKSKGGMSPPLLHDRRSPSRNHRSLSRSPSCYQRRSPSSYRSPSHSRRSKSRLKSPPRNDDFERDRSIPKSNSSDELSFFSVFNRLRDPSHSLGNKSRTLLLSPSLPRRSKYRTRKSPPRTLRSPSRTLMSPPRTLRSPPRTLMSPPRTLMSLPYMLRSPPPTLGSPSHMLRSPPRTLGSPAYRSHRGKSRSRRSSSWSLRSRSRSRNPSRSRSKSRTYRSPSRSRRSKSRAYRSPSRSRRSRSRTYRSPSRSRRSRSRPYRSPSRSHRSKSRRRTPRGRSDSRSPSEIRAARKCSPLEDMRQQLRKDNEAAVQQALGGLEQPKKNPSVRIIDNVDLTKSPSPEPIPTIGHVRSTTASAATRDVVPQQQRPLHSYNATALNQNYSKFLRRIAGLTPMHPHAGYLHMPVPMVQNPSGILNQTSVFHISHVFSQAAGPPENYVPMYQPHPPYM